MSVAPTKEFAEGDGYFQTRFMMIRAHEALLKGLDSVTAQALDDHSSDMHNWLGYCSSWGKAVHHHHSLEEKHIFPFFSSRGLDVHEELDAHKKLHDDLDALNSAVESWKTNPASYDGQRLKALLDGLAPNFRTHLHDEVENLAKERLEPKVTSEELKTCLANLVKDAQKGDPFVDLPFMMTHTPKEHKYWTNLGWFMYKVMIPAFSWRHYGYWKYAPEPLNL